MFGFNNKADYHRFEHKPIYWDPKKEEREARERRIRAELAAERGEEVETDDEKAPYGISFREEFRKHRNQKLGSNGMRTVRIFMILLFILMAVFYIYVKYGDRLIKYIGV